MPFSGTAPDTCSWAQGPASRALIEAGGPARSRCLGEGAGGLQPGPGSQPLNANAASGPGVGMPVPIFASPG